MKGIILAGGSGSRLYPITKAVSKQLLPVYDKPMIYYPLSTLMLGNIKDILIITTPYDAESFKRLLGDGSDFGINLSYAVQEWPNGIAEAFIIGKDFIGDDNVCLILGDNIFYGNGLTDKLITGFKNAGLNDCATIYTYKVSDPERYGVATTNLLGDCISIEEKPKNPMSNNAVVGLYVYPNNVCDFVKDLNPSERGELEITDLNEMYLSKKALKVIELGRGFAWLDTGTHESLMEASNFIETIEKRQGFKVACLEEIAYNKKWIKLEDIKRVGESMASNEYGQYLLSIYKNEIPTVRQCLSALEYLGWSELIDDRWKEDVKKDLLEEFQNITSEVLEETLNIVIMK